MKGIENLSTYLFPAILRLDLAPIPFVEVAKVSQGLIPPPFFISLFE